MTSTRQQTFDFDLATLNACVARLTPKPLRTLFRGLLFAAAQQPSLVSDIDSEGWLMMTAPKESVATWANVTDRSIRKTVADNTTAVKPDGSKILFDGLIEVSADSNSASQWFFNLNRVLPSAAIDWFSDLVETTKVPPGTFKSSARNFCASHPELLSKVPNEVHPELLKFSSMCLVLNTASLASLAGCCGKTGIAVSCSDGTWEGLSVDPDGLQSAAVIEGLYELATTSGTIEANATNRNRWFTLAAIASRKDMPWSFFRRAVSNGWLLTTNATSVDAANGRKLRRQADELKTARTVPAVAIAAPAPAPEQPTSVLSDEDRQRIMSGKFARRLRPVEQR